MQDVSVIESPWGEVFENLLSESTKFDFVSPFIKNSAAKYVVNSDLDARGITVLTPNRYVTGASDIEAIELLLDNGAILKSIKRLHAKIYLFDRCAIVTSANLTDGGLNHNIEYGVLIRRKDIIAKVRSDFSRMFDKGLDVDREIVQFIRNVVEQTPESTRMNLIKTTTDEYPDTRVIANALTGWKREVFQVINQFPDDIFSLQDLYNYERHKQHFARLYPNNKHIQAKIRQSLQFLRDLHLIEFLEEKGRYRRLV